MESVMQVLTFIAGILFMIILIALMSAVLFIGAKRLYKDYKNGDLW